MLEIGEGLFDGIEVGTVGRQEEELGAYAADGFAGGLALWLPRLSMMTMSPDRSVGPLIGPLKRQGASIRSTRSAARKVSVRQRQCGALPISRWPRPPAPERGHVGLGPGFVDEHQALGIDHRLTGLPSPTSPDHVRPVLLSRERRFLEAEPLGVHEASHRLLAHRDP